MSYKIEVKKLKREKKNQERATYYSEPRTIDKYELTVYANKFICTTVRNTRP